MGHQFEALVVSAHGSGGLEQACPAQAWDRGLGWRRQWKPRPVWEQLLSLLMGGLG